MPGKTRRNRTKYSAQSQKKKGAVVHSAPIKQTLAKEATTPSEILTPEGSEATVTRKTTSVLYPYITKELRTIGILSVIMLIILFLLARVLS